MSLFDSASLVVTPNGVKEGKLYSIKPTDGSGDLSVTRATTATRVNSSGLVELVPYNLATYSNTFSNADYIKTNVTLTANQAETPDTYGLSSLFVPAAAVGNRYLARTIDNQSKLYSIFLKKKELSYVKLGTANSYVVVNLNNGTLSTSSDVYNNYSITDVGNEWYRVGVYNKTTSAQVQIFGGVSSTGTNVATNGTDGFYIYGFQLVDGSVEKPYFPTTDRLNIPRLDYTNGTCPSILVEPQRTNTYRASEELDNAIWTKQATTVTANSSTAPNGTISADKLIPTTANSNHAIYFTSTSSSTFVVSIFAKANGYNFLNIRDQFSGLFNVYFNLSAGTCGAGGVIQNYGNGWYRCSVSVNNLLALTAIPTYSVSNNGTSLSFAGDGTSGLLIWGAQFEVGTYITSYIPTTVASSVTRNADVISKTDLSLLPTSYPFTLFADGYLRQNNDVLVGIINIASSDQYYNIGATANGFIATARNTTLSSASSSSGRLEGFSKVAAVFTSSQITLYANGNLIGTVSNTTAFNTNANDLLLSQLRVNSDNGQRCSLKTVAIFNYALSNAELATLTTI